MAKPDRQAGEAAVGAGELRGIAGEHAVPEAGQLVRSPTVGRSEENPPVGEAHHVRRLGVVARDGNHPEPGEDTGIAGIGVPENRALVQGGDAGLEMEHSLHRNRNQAAAHPATERFQPGRPGGIGPPPHPDEHRRTDLQHIPAVEGPLVEQVDVDQLREGIGHRAGLTETGWMSRPGDQRRVADDHRGVLYEASIGVGLVAGHDPNLEATHFERRPVTKVLVTRPLGIERGNGGPPGDTTRERVGDLTDEGDRAPQEPGSDTR